MTVFRLSEQLVFPDPNLAEPDGLLAVGGDLSSDRLILAYELGIFPWFSEGYPFLWWAPNPRLVLFPRNIHLSKSLKKNLRKNEFIITLDQAFTDVINACAQIRNETWITQEMIDAYSTLHNQGYAHSVEAWQGSNLVGGLYGVSLGGCFFGESMFAHQPNASKVAFATLVSALERHNFDLVDCQVSTDHLVRFGAVEISRTDFLSRLSHSLKKPTLKGNWAEKMEKKGTLK